jgi:glycolate oxidase iron-sulfur subunit
VLDIHELLAGRLGELELAAGPVRVTVHDACHLGRGQGLAKTVRSVLRAVPGTDLVEMEEPGRCCGFGGVMRATHPALSKAIGAAKAEEIGRTGAQVVATGCPGCRMQISDALRAAGSGAAVVHTVQVIAAALRAAGHGDAARGRRGEKEVRKERVAAGFSLRRRVQQDKER